MKQPIDTHDLENVREQIQSDLLCFMDGLPREAQVRACQIVVDRFVPLMYKASFNSKKT